MRRLILVLLFAVAAWPADSDFNGRWDITVHNSKRARAWWLEVQGAGTPSVKGKFIGFPGGDLNDIQEIKVEQGQLHFTYDGHSEHQEYRARMEGGKLE